MSPSLFQSTRLKLTLQYTLIMLAISVLISAVFFLRTDHVLQLEFDRINQRFQLEEQGMQPRMGPNPLRRRINPDDLTSARNQLLRQVVGINFLVALSTFGLGYLLSGFTLRPIETAMTAQKRFLGDAAHELKTPLTVLKTSLEINLMEKDLPPSIKTMLKSNLKDVITLETLTEGLLKLSSSLTSKSLFHPTPVKPAIAQAIAQVSPLANKKHITFITKSIPLGLTITSDPSILSELLVIFLDNAIKYSNPHSTITISATTAKKFAHLSIADQGIGIAPEHLPHIFERFYQADPSRSKSATNGFGLGLALAKQLVDKHHGQLEVDSTEGKGTTFTLKLPLA